MTPQIDYLKKLHAEAHAGKTGSWLRFEGVMYNILPAVIRYLELSELVIHSFACDSYTVRNGHPLACDCDNGMVILARNAVLAEIRKEMER